MTTTAVPVAAAGARERLDAATAHLDPPLAVVDLDALDANAADLVRRAGGRPIRVASKSVRCRALLRRVLDRPGFAGVLAYTLAEALWLAGGNDPVSTDVLVGYPSVDRAALRRLGGDEQLADRVTLMVDSVAHLDLLDAVAPPATRPVVQVCLDLDASWRVGPAHVGVRRSPVHSPAEAAALARAVVARPGVRLVGVMAYEAQVAGVGDAPAGRPVRGLAVRGMQRASVRELAVRRAAAVAAVREVADLRFVNGGGTGSLERTAAEESVTELAAGSGLYSPTLFDGYRSFRGRPAALFALPVTRRPAAGVVTVAGGGWIASGPPGRDRSPTPVHPAGLHLLASEGAGEVQTPLRGPGTAELAIGDRVWFRHAKAGELCERVDELHLVQGDGLADVVVNDVVPTYRGQGRSFG
ncbi:amino acid deaminase/aldolase [Modestobacter roseus]|uniref:D-serine deaminase-like pyridoxal phosphate-dependent protein n=1 Tax=Modestobacter roseus TaxID=1181884 RepID=A0A562IM07_9ACTN|nr:amino acid deaminase/aldolase [Modestobacter roseus]MQA34252.1 amino acid deaminase/aldolase [Modestobacter roseus]TWH71912.1 D-serine deaminase-like pyridoxal phosphate-dependent protein [Modestobacter roseus]